MTNFENLKYPFDVYATQGGGIAKKDEDDQFVFIDPPEGYLYGQTVPQEWEVHYVKVYKEKEKPKFGRGHFPVGTTCEVTLDFGSDKGIPIPIIVQSLFANGPNSFVIETNVPNEFTGGNECYNLYYVTRIIKRGPGIAKLSKVERTELKIKSFSYIETDLKHRNQYMITSPRELIYALAQQYMTDDMCLDGEKLQDLLAKRGFFVREENIDKYDWAAFFKVHRVSKKKLNRAIRQLINKCLVKRYKEQERQDTVNNDAYFSELDDEWERDHKEIVELAGLGPGNDKLKISDEDFGSDYVNDFDHVSGGNFTPLTPDNGCNIYGEFTALVKDPN